MARFLQLSCIMIPIAEVIIIIIPLPEGLRLVIRLLTVIFILIPGTRFLTLSGIKCGLK